MLLKPKLNFLDNISVNEVTERCNRITGFGTQLQTFIKHKIIIIIIIKSYKISKNKIVIITIYKYNINNKK